MKPYDPMEEQAIQALMENLPMSTNAPEELKDRLIDLATSPAPEHRRVRRPLFAFAAGGVSIIAAIAVMTSLPATARSWEGIKQAAQSIQRMELVVRDLKEKDTIARVAYDAGTVLVELPHESVFVRDGVVLVYDKRKKVVQEFSMPAGKPVPDIGGSIMKELGMSKLLAAFERECGKENIDIGATRMWQGRQVYDAKLQDPQGRGYANLVIDAASDLPIYIERFELENGWPIKRIEVVANYNGAVPANSLKPNFPKNAAFESHDLSKVIESNGGRVVPPGLSITRLMSR